jgi:hypothetical protein
MVCPSMSGSFKSKITREGKTLRAVFKPSLPFDAVKTSQPRNSKKAFMESKREA